MIWEPREERREERADVQIAMMRPVAALDTSHQTEATFVLAVAVKIG